MPPLRMHRADILPIARQMIETMNERHGCRVAGISESLLSRLNAYDWPGNVRELRNLIERATILAGRGLLSVEHLPPLFGLPAATSRTTAPGTTAPGATNLPVPSETEVRLPVGTTVDEAEKQLILRTLLSTQHNKTKAAEILGISSKTLQNKLKEYKAVSSGKD
jgi:DNA-binding NtrC family response regulator